MKRLEIVGMVVLALVVLSTAAAAQTRPDFSGAWRYNQGKSSRGSWGNEPKVAFPMRLTIQQSAGDMQVVMNSDRQADLTAVYKFDGSPAKITAPAGVTETATVNWDGPRFVVAGRRSFTAPFLGEIVSETKELWTLAGNVLTIQKTRTAEGVAQTETAVYDKVPAH